MLLTIISGGLFMCCKTMPKQMSPVSGFDPNRFLGEWYEIARYDFMFEKNMSKVRAAYFMNGNGTIKIVNSGYDFVAQKYKTKTGTAKFVGPQSEGRLKVTFFWPFYSGYNVVALDQNYQYALIAGDNLNLMWILSRTPTIPDDIKNNYLDIARQMGYNTSKLIWTLQ